MVCASQSSLVSAWGVCVQTVSQSRLRISYNPGCSSRIRQPLEVSETSIRTSSISFACNRMAFPTLVSSAGPSPAKDRTGECRRSWPRGISYGIPIKITLSRKWNKTYIVQDAVRLYDASRSLTRVHSLTVPLRSKKHSLALWRQILTCFLSPFLCLSRYWKLSR